MSSLLELVEKVKADMSMAAASPSFALGRVLAKRYGPKRSCRELLRAKRLAKKRSARSLKGYL